jgi:hypothetical protein
LTPPVPVTPVPWEELVEAVAEEPGGVCGLILKAFRFKKLSTTQKIMAWNHCVYMFGMWYCEAGSIRLILKMLSFAGSCPNPRRYGLKSSCIYVRNVIYKGESIRLILKAFCVKFSTTQKIRAIDIQHYSGSWSIYFNVSVFIFSLLTLTMNGTMNMTMTNSSAGFLIGDRMNSRTW